MKRKSWVTPIIVFLICIGSLFIYQNTQFTTSLANPCDIPPVLWDIEPNDINRVIFNQSGKKIEAFKQDSNWELVGSDYTNANDLYIHNLIDTFKRPTLLRIVSDNPSTLSEYGIDYFSKSISFYGKDNTYYELIFGNQASATTYYVYSPFTKTIYTISKDSFNMVTNSPKNWRDSNYLYFDKKDTSKIIITYEGKEYTLSPSVVNGNILFSCETLSRKIIDDIILFLESTRIKEFITVNATDSVLSTYGFNQPILKITVYTSKGNTTTINIGSMLPEENLGYVRMNDQKAIFAIPYFDLIPKEEVKPTK